MGKRHRIIPIFIPHLGCPYQCIYCDQRTITAAAVPTPAEVADFIERSLATIPDHASVEVAFFGGNFTAIEHSQQESFLQVVQQWLPAGRVQGIRVSTRPDAINSSHLRWLQTYGVNCIELGVQSLDESVLKLSGRGYNVGVVEHSAALIKQQGIQLGLQLMIGLPGDNREKDLISTDLAIAMRPAMVRLYPTLVLEHTALATQYRLGHYQAVSLDEAVSTCCAMWRKFRAAGIPVIRMGLQSSEELKVMAGPWHPAFGELVQQYDFWERARFQLRNQTTLAPVLRIGVHPQDISRMIGQHRSNIVRLETEFSCRLLVQGDERLAPGSISVTAWDRE